MPHFAVFVRRLNGKQESIGSWKTCEDASSVAKTEVDSGAAIVAWIDTDGAEEPKRVFTYAGIRNV